MIYFKYKRKGDKTMTKVIYMVVDEDKNLLLFETLNRVFAYRFATRNSVNKHIKVYIRKTNK